MSDDWDSMIDNYDRGHRGNSQYAEHIPPPPPPPPSGASPSHSGAPPPLPSSLPSGRAPPPMPASYASPTPLNTAAGQGDVAAQLAARFRARDAAQGGGSTVPAGAAPYTPTFASRTMTPISHSPSTSYDASSSPSAAANIGGMSGLGAAIAARAAKTGGAPPPLPIGGNASAGQKWAPTSPSSVAPPSPAVSSPSMRVGPPPMPSSSSGTIRGVPPPLFPRVVVEASTPANPATMNGFPTSSPSPTSAGAAASLPPPPPPPQSYRRPSVLAFGVSSLLPATSPLSSLPTIPAGYPTAYPPLSSSISSSSFVPPPPPPPPSSSSSSYVPPPPAGGPSAPSSLVAPSSSSSSASRRLSVSTSDSAAARRPSLFQGLWGMIGSLSGSPAVSGARASGNESDPLAPVMHELAQVYAPFPDTVQEAANSAAAQAGAAAGQGHVKRSSMTKVKVIVTALRMKGNRTCGSKTLTPEMAAMLSSPSSMHAQSSPGHSSTLSSSQLSAGGGDEDSLWNESSQSSQPGAKPKRWLRFMEIKSGSSLYMNTVTNSAQGDRPDDYDGSDNEDDEDDDGDYDLDDRSERTGQANRANRIEARARASISSNGSSLLTTAGAHSTANTSDSSNSSSSSSSGSSTSRSSTLHASSTLSAPLTSRPDRANSVDENEMPMSVVSASGVGAAVGAAPISLENFLSSSTLYMKQLEAILAASSSKAGSSASISLGEVMETCLTQLLAGLHDVQRLIDADSTGRGFGGGNEVDNLVLLSKLPWDFSAANENIALYRRQTAAINHDPFKYRDWHLPQYLSCFPLPPDTRSVTIVVKLPGQDNAAAAAAALAQANGRGVSIDVGSASSTRIGVTLTDTCAAAIAMAFKKCGTIRKETAEKEIKKSKRDSDFD